MRNRQVTLLDVGLDQSFDASMSFVQATLQNINAGLESPICDINFVRSRDLYTVAAALTAPCDVLHVMAHGDHAESPAFSSSGGELVLSLEDVARMSIEWTGGIAASTIVADGCKTGIGVWKRAMRHCLQGPVTYIGTSTLVGWHESTVFSAAFYGALFRNKGKGKAPAAQSLDAAERASKAYYETMDKNAPFQAATLTPSRRALRGEG